MKTVKSVVVPLEINVDSPTSASVHVAGVMFYSCHNEPNAERKAHDKAQELTAKFAAKLATC